MLSSADKDGSAWLGLPEEELHKVVDANFATSMRRRLGLPVRAGAATRCQNKRADGSACGQELDAEGHHPAHCACGGGRNRRHDSVRDSLPRHHSG